MDNDKDKMVEIARFQFPADAYTLMALLKAEGINCYLRNEKTASLLSYIDVGGARVEILESDLPKALEVMKEGGYDENGKKRSQRKENSGKGSFLNQIPFIRKFPFPVQVILYILLLIMVIIIALMV